MIVLCITSLRVFAQSVTQPGSLDLYLLSGGDKIAVSGFNIRQSSPVMRVDPDLKFPIAGLNEEYIKRSRRQKRTALILLGTGVALITTGIAVAYANDDDAIKAGVSLVLIGGTGLTISLISIPFFIASARSKRKAKEMSSSIELLQSPFAMQTGIGYRTYPGLKLKLAF
ncbi:MAG: hypothetical protein DI535_21065 [Citrobacter freundii]|nr:MAG: hypothetical protein DI535_21065 [Citrobacter freundii]